MKRKNVLVIIIFVIIFFILGLLVISNRWVDNTIRAVVIRVDEKYLEVMELVEDNWNLYTIKYSTNDNINFKQGQEILIYYNEESIIEQSGGTISKNDIKKIKILKEKSDTEIPNELLRRVFSSTANISISIEDISLTGVSLIIKDTNDYKYGEYTKYDIYKKNNSSLNGNSWEEVPRISADEKEVSSVNIDNNTVKKVYSWKNSYNKLESGEYMFQIASSEKPFVYIKIQFTIDENDKILYNEPSLFLWI